MRTTSCLKSRRSRRQVRGPLLDGLCESLVWSSSVVGPGARRALRTLVSAAPPGYAAWLWAKKYGPQPVRTEARECGSGYAMERAVREGDTGLHHTATTRRCLLDRDRVRISMSSQWSVRSIRTKTVREHFAASAPEGALARSSSQTTRLVVQGSARGRIMPCVHRISTRTQGIFDTLYTVERTLPGIIRASQAYVANALASPTTGKSRVSAKRTPMTFLVTRTVFTSSQGST